MKTERIIAFYLPQYYPTEINNRNYGEGFTEWTNVGKARRLFPGHDQPRVPADLGYYDLRLPEVREAQARLAAEAGIEGFCYYHYWFSQDHTELDLVLNEVLRLKKPDFPFCLCWANQSWYSKFWNADLACTPRLIAEQLYDDPAGIEKPVAALGPADRPVRLFYTDPHCSSQKPHVERTHRDVRRILEHGVSFDSLDQADVNLVMSHVNSYTRGVLDGRCAWDEFVGRHGEPGRLFLERLGLRRIPANDVTLDPYLLGKGFQRLAAKAVLRKHGVLPAPDATDRK